jgi:hypothetical protein
MLGKSSQKLVTCFVEVFAGGSQAKQIFETCKWQQNAKQNIFTNSGKRHGSKGWGLRVVVWKTLETCEKNA